MPDARRRDAPAREAARLRRRDGAREGHARRSAGTHPFSLFERQRNGDDRYRALIDQMQYIARRELIFGMHVHVAVDDPRRRSGREGCCRNRAAARALGELALRRGEPTGLRPPAWSSRVPAFWAASPLPRLRRLRGGRPHARALGPHLDNTSIGGTSASPAARHGRDPELRRRHACRGCRRDRRVLPGRREAVLRGLRGRRRDRVASPDPDEREQVARGALRAQVPVLTR